MCVRLWPFAYERYNGILEHYPSNNRSLEIQLMKREFQLHISLAYLPDEFESDFGELSLNHA